MIVDILAETLSLAVSPRQLVSLVNEFNRLSAPILLIIGIALAFFGRRFVKSLVFLAGGVIGAALGFALFSSLFSGIIPIVGAVVGFVVVGLIAYGLMHIAFGLILAAVSFSLTRLLVSNTLIALIVAIIGLIIGVLLFNSYLSIATAIGGGLMVWHALQILGLQGIAPLAGIAIVIIGALIQLRQLG